MRGPSFLCGAGSTDLLVVRVHCGFFLDETIPACHCSIGSPASPWRLQCALASELIQSK